MLHQIDSSKMFDCDAHLNEALKLHKSGFYTASFLQYWRIVEVTAKELMVIFKASEETVNWTNNAVKVLKRHGVGFSEDSITVSISNSVYSLAEKNARGSCRNLDVGVIKKALKNLDIDYDESWIDFLFGTVEKNLPDDIKLDSKTTIRNRRNLLTHTNHTVDEFTLDQIVPIFNQFLTVIESIKE